MVHDNRLFDNYLKLFNGNRYEATIYVARKARKLAEYYHNVISHAEALNWVLSGQVPDGVLHYKDRIKMREQRELKFAKDYLSTIQDDNVRNSVLISLKRTKEAHHLLYRYEGVYAPHNQARVRILTNKLWDEMRRLDYI